MAKSTNQQIAEHFRALASLYADLEATSTSTKSKSKKAEEDVEDVEEEEDEDLPAPTRGEVESLGIKELRELASKHGIESKKKADILEAFEDLYEEDDDDEDEEPEDVDEDKDDEDEDGDYDRDDLEELTLKRLREIAKEEGHTASDYKGMDKDALVDLILGEDDEDEDEDDEDEDDDDDDDVEELDEDDLKQMTHKELMGLAKELDVKVPKAVQKSSAANKKKLVDLILESGEDED